MDVQNSFTAKREVNLQRNPCNTYHHTFSMSPHYLVKVRSSNVW